MKKLKVTSIRYFDTRRGLGYQCQTNWDKVEVWNDGCGGETFLEVPDGKTAAKFKDIDSDQLEKLIDEFENDKTPLKKFRIFLEEELGGATSLIIHEKSEENILSRFHDLPLLKVEEVTDE